ncbi:MAG TPA: glycosyl hydrolase [Acidobacteriaceae bacterium]|nr:glycosyl hydrolase [Acidobacteriaceae bacterium]
MPLNRRSFIQSALLAGSAIKLRALTTHLSAATTDITTLRSQFREPPKKFRPIVRWWWPGDDVDEPELLRELSALDDAWFGGAEIQAFNKAFPDDFLAAEKDRINGFATDSFFRHVATVARGARDRGLFIDYTFGSGWPFGGGEAITPELAAIELRSSHLSVQGPGTFHSRLQIPSIADSDGLPAGWAERIKKRATIVAVIAVRGSEPQFAFHQTDGHGRAVFASGDLIHDTAVDLTANLQPDGLLHWEIPSGTWQLFLFLSTPTGQRLNAGAGAGPQLVMDHLSADAFRAHAARVGDAAIPFLKDVLGNGMRAIFCDSLEVRGNIFWSDDFLAEFKRRRGYDLQPYLPILQVQTANLPYARFYEMPYFDIKGIGDQVRHDYRLTVAELMTERFYSQFNRWAHDHNLLSRTQAHGAPVDVLRVYEEADIPETEQLYDEGCYDFLKLASSAAHINGRALVGSESFVWPSAAYQTTPEKMKLAADELFTAGINAIVFHGFPYQVPGIPAPGWHPFSGSNHSGNYSSQFNELNPLWPYFAQVNRYLSRLQFILQSAKTVPAVAVFRDTLTHGAEEAPPTPPLNQAIMDAGYFYDYINGDSLLQSKIDNKSLITVAGTKYRALILPSIDSLPADVAEKIESFASAGLPVLFFGDAPTRASSFASRVEDTQRVEHAMAAIRSHPGFHTAAQIPSLISALSTASAPNIRFHGDPFFFIQKQLDDTSLFFLRNESDQLRKLDAEFEAEGEPQLWDPWTGDIAGLSFTRTGPNKVAIKLDLQPLSSALIAFSPNSAQHLPLAKQLSAYEMPITQDIGTSGWTLVATETVPASGARIIRRTLPLLVDWSLDPELRSFCGRGVYTTSFTLTSKVHESRIVLDLGSVREVADVKINGTPVGTLLLRPYQIDITEHVHAGDNTLEVAVTNTLFNAMALRTPRNFTPGPTENASGLMSGGLIGPVRLQYMRTKS